MKLSGNTNAHGAVWSDGIYQTKICFDEIFGVPYNGATPHQCLAQNGNFLVALNANTNAHAAEVSSPQYKTPICYGDLKCDLKASCNLPGEREVLSLSGTTNAHLDRAGGGDSYANKLCCTSLTAGNNPCGDGDLDQGEACDDGNNIPGDGCSATCTIEQGQAECGNGICEGGETKQSCPADCQGDGSVTEVKWKDSEGDVITKATLGAEVKLFAKTIGIAPGAIIKFEIREDDGNTGDDDILVGNQALQATVSGNGEVTASWTISDAIYKGNQDGLNGNQPENGDFELYFKASLASKPAIFKESSNLATGVFEKCSDYATQLACNDDDYNVVMVDPLWDDEDCDADGDPTECLCTWKNNDCIFKVINHDDDDDNNGECGDPTSCEITDYVVGECVDGFQTITITKEFNGNNCVTSDPTCVSSQENIFCAKPSVRLPFFGGMQIITSLLAIAAIYLLYGRRSA